MMEWVKYSSYGVPFGLPAGDTDNGGGMMAIVIKVISIILMQYQCTMCTATLTWI